MISIFEYTDYRKYLLDFYRQQKLNKKSFSYRYFAKAAGINSVGLYKDVIEGRQNLGRALIYKFSNAMGHSKNEAEYFENMVYMNESETVEEKTRFFEKMMACRTTKVKVIDSVQFEYYQRWYYSAIRAFIACNRFKDERSDHTAIAKTLNPQIRPDQAQKALKILERLELIRKNDEGYFILADGNISTGSLRNDKTVGSLQIVNFQKEMMKLAQGAFDRFPTEQLNMSTLTLTVSPKTIAVIKDELAALRNKIAALTQADAAADRVVQLNIQMFPVSDSSGEAEHA